MRNVPISLLLIVACVFASAAEPPAKPAAAVEKGVDKSLLEAMALPADTKLIYRDENGKEITAAQFAKRTQEEGASFEMKRDEAGGSATLTLKPKLTPASEVGAIALLPPLDLHDLFGRRIRNLDLAGRPTLINFFFETCVPCIKEAPVLNLYRRRHMEFNYLAITPDGAEAARRFVQQRNFDWPVAYDGQPFIDAMKVTGYPTYVLVASDGRILGRGTGMDPRDMQDQNRALGEFEKWVSARLTRRD